MFLLDSPAASLSGSSQISVEKFNHSLQVNFHSFPLSILSLLLSTAFIIDFTKKNSNNIDGKHSFAALVSLPTSSLAGNIWRQGNINSIVTGNSCFLDMTVQSDWPIKGTKSTTQFYDFKCFRELSSPPLAYVEWRNIISGYFRSFLFSVEKDYHWQWGGWKLSSTIVSASHKSLYNS